MNEININCKIKIKLIFILFLYLVFWTNCSVSHKLSRNYIGKTEQYLISEMGNPSKITQISTEKKVAVYEKKSRLNKAPINTGQFQYDQFESPEVTKVEVYRFIIGASGIVEKVEYESMYER